MIVLPIVREDVAVGRRRIETAKVRIRKLVHRQVATIDDAVVREQIVIARVPMDRIVSGPIKTRREGDTLVVPVLEEVLVKQLRLVEEVRITTRRRVQRRTTAVPVRHEEVVVERSRVATGGGR